MKDKSVLWILAVLAPFLITLGIVAECFRASRISFWDLILPPAVLLIDAAFLWHHLVDVPIRHLISALARAVKGDYRARLSCGCGPESFRKLSGLFNQMMSCVEKQTEELNGNRRLQNQLYENEKGYRNALELICERVFEADLTHDRLLYGKEQYRRAFPCLNTESFDEMIRGIADRAVFPADREAFRRTFSRRGLSGAFRRSGSSEITLEYRQQSAGGGPYWVEATVIRLNSPAGGENKIIGYVKNIDERKRRELQILRQSQQDGLTGLFNKVTTQDRIERFLQNEGKNGKHAVIMIDIDDFKAINDMFGHTEGDSALVKVSQQILRLFRSTDIAGRVGGDEFLVLMKDVASLEILLLKLKQINGLFGEIRLQDEPSFIGSSIGVALYPCDGTRYEVLYQNADAALYESKAHGKGRFSLYGSRYGETCGTPGFPAPGIPEESGRAPRQEPAEGHARLSS